MRIGVCVALAFVAGCKGSSEGHDMSERDVKTLPASCAEYRKALDPLPRCEAMTKQELANLWHGYLDASSAWVNRDVSRMPANTLRAIDVACKWGRDHVRERVAAQCAPEPVERDLFGDAPGTLPPECDEYRAMIYKLSECEKLPKQSRDALREGFDTMVRAWKDIDTMPREAREAMADGCREGAKALRQAAIATCRL
jgi:hypothetical protein